MEGEFGVGSKQRGPMSTCSYSSGHSNLQSDLFFRATMCHGLLLRRTTISKVWAAPCIYAPFYICTTRDSVCSSTVNLPELKISQPVVGLSIVCVWIHDVMYDDVIYSC